MDTRSYPEKILSAQECDKILCLPVKLKLNNTFLTSNFDENRTAITST